MSKSSIMLHAQSYTLPVHTNVLDAVAGRTHFVEITPLDNLEIG